ncbi:NAD(P)/FAD-dependent oxidoreductase [Saccharopolyspora sp. NPDC047091]|uniref:FAD-dependent oxidoreductase n=1 Tax=Saccharopolyspora sp. NPDC047091 TaxID=3155924 RepID=UPI0033F8A0A9
MSPCHVLIAGGGMGGLCLAQGLRRRGISCAVYESAPGIVRSGYRLHMNAAGGGALRQCLPDHLYELYVQTSRAKPRRERLVLLDHLARELGTRPHIGPANDPERPHTAVDRRALRQIMSVGLDDVLHFGRTVTGFEDDGERVRLLFTDGSSATGDVLVAADGIRSAVRRQLLPHVATVDTGARGVASRAPLTDELVAALPAALFDGFAIATGPDGTTFAYGAYQPRRPVAEAAAELAPGADIDPVEPYLMVNFGLPRNGPLATEVPDLWRATPERLHAAMRTAVTGWHPALAELVEHVDPETLLRQSLRHLEPAEPWATGRVTLLGDAIHAMPPTFGAGANSALRDAAALANALQRAAQDDSDLLAEIAAYEADLRAEVFPVLRASADPRSTSSDFLPDDLPVAHR